MPINHYVYGLEDPKTNQFYFGSRSFNGDPKEDTYMGSMVTWIPDNKDILIKHILYSNLKTREEAMSIEASFQKRFINNKLNENYYITNKGFHGFGRIKSEEEIEKIRASRIKNGCTMSDQTKKRMGEKLSKLFKGKKKSKDHIDKIAASIKKNKSLAGKNNPMHGKKHSKKIIQKIRERSGCPTKGKFGKDHPNSKKIVQLDLNENIVQIWNSQKDIEREFGFNQGNISNACKHKYGRNNTNKAYGFIWKILEEK